MANWNGLVASATDITEGSTFTEVNTAVPAKFFPHGQFAVSVVDGVSGNFYVDVIGAVGGATFVIAGRTNITGVGSFPVPLIVYGESGSQSGYGIPRPYGVDFANGISFASGFTASVYFSGEY